MPYHKDNVKKRSKNLQKEWTNQSSKIRSQVYEGGGEAILYLLSCIRRNACLFATEAEQIRKFENDEVAQHYFEVLRTLISKNPFCSTSRSQGSGQLFGEIFTAAGAKVEVDDSYTAPL